jgi:hypothetical protein
LEIDALKPLALAFVATNMSKIKATAFLLAAALPITLSAQSPLRLPQASPGAVTGQTIGITDVTISYHRPTVNKRKIWDGLVPYGVVWRAGANENTTIAFSTPVKVEGKPLPAGTYGVFMLPGASEWTVMFSKFSADWGAYSYDPSEDAARISVTPQPAAELQERLLYTFDDVTDKSATASLRWEKVRVPFRIEVDLPATIRASFRDELRGGKHWNSDAWATAARWELRNGDLEAALKDADQAMAMGATFTALRTKAAVLEKKGDAKGAAELRERAKSIANEAETINVTTAPLMGEKKYDEAIAYLSGYAGAHPQSPQLFRVYALLGDAHAAKGDSAKAHASYEKAMAAAHDVSERTEVQDSINAAGAEGK